jgi:hypothetical protein
LRQEKRRVALVTGVDKKGRRIGAVTYKNANRLTGTQRRQAIRACRRWLVAQIFKVTESERLDEDWMNEIQMSNQPDAGTIQGFVGEFPRRTFLAANPGKLKFLASAFKQLLYA